MRDGSPDAQAALSRQGRYQSVRDNLRVKEVHIGEGDAAKRFIICHNPAEAERERTQRDETIARLQAELERIERRPTARRQPTRTPAPSARSAITPRSGATWAMSRSASSHYESRVAPRAVSRR